MESNEKRTLAEIREEATNLGMTPEDAGRYIEEEWQAQQLAADQAEANYYMQES